MKRARLIYNRNAGSSSAVSVEHVLESLRKSGYTPQYEETSREEELDSVLRQPTDLVVVAGGDGSLRAVAKRLLKQGVRPAVTVLPLGTANNIATMTHEATQPDINDLLAGLDAPLAKPFDIGKVQYGEHEDIFLEAAGIGMFASMMYSYKPDAGKSAIRAVQAMVQTLSSFTAPTLQLTLDGQIVEGNFVLLEVMNTNAAGPRLPFAPHANASDGLFDIVMINEDQRVGFLAYLNSLMSETLEELPNVSVQQVKSLELQGETLPIHVDAEMIEQPVMPVKFEVMAGALELWLPAQMNQEAETTTKTGAYATLT